jgi:hypothetical protein
MKPVCHTVLKKRTRGFAPLPGKPTSRIALGSATGPLGCKGPRVSAGTAFSVSPCSCPVAAGKCLSSFVPHADRLNFPAYPDAHAGMTAVLAAYGRTPYDVGCDKFVLRLCDFASRLDGRRELWC